MRRYALCLAMLPGLFLQSSLPAAAAHHGGPAGHVSSHLSAHAHAAHAHGSHGAPPPATRRALVHARHKASHLRPTHVTETAMIDPVPVGKFPFPPPLKGSHESLVRQNVRSQEDGLTRIQDDAQLLSMRKSGELVSIPAAASLTVDERLPANRRFCRAWTAQFLADVSSVHYARFHRPLQVNSAVRTVDYQRHLLLVNGNAAPAEGDDASPHLTGATIDIAKKGLSMDEVGWMRAYLSTLQQAGKIDVEEEFYQSCFHITVYRSYRRETPLLEAGAKPNLPHGSGAALLAEQVR